MRREHVILEKQHCYFKVVLCSILLERFVFDYKGLLWQNDFNAFSKFAVWNVTIQISNIILTTSNIVSII